MVSRIDCLLVLNIESLNSYCYSVVCWFKIGESVSSWTSTSIFFYSSSSNGKSGMFGGAKIYMPSVSLKKLNEYWNFYFIQKKWWNLDWSGLSALKHDPFSNFWLLFIKALFNLLWLWIFGYFLAFLLFCVALVILDPFSLLWPSFSLEFSL